MGLFEKKTYTCQRCGKEYTSRFGAGNNLCADCKNHIYDLQGQVQGYIDYARALKLNSNFSEEEMNEIIRQREELLNTKCVGDIDIRKALTSASKNYRSLSQDEIEKTVDLITTFILTEVTGAAFNEFFISPSNYKDVVVSIDDVFAVAITKINVVETANSQNVENVLCTIFTNNKYVPVIPMIYGLKMGGFDVFKSKRGRRGVEAYLTLLFPNLTYPVCDHKEFKNIIKNEAVINGNIDKEQILKYLSDAKHAKGIFRTEDICSITKINSLCEIGKHGYLVESEIEYIMQYKYKDNANFWNGHISAKDVSIFNHG